MLRDVADFGAAVGARLRRVLDDDLVGVYFVGSVALGGYVPGESDIDIIAVSADPIADEVKHQVTEGLLDEAARCPARGLEFTLYRWEVASAPPRATDFEVNVNGGPRMPVAVHLVAAHEPAFWYVLDRAIAHRYGVSIAGPPPRDVFADAPRQKLLHAMVESMRWHRANEGATLYSVLNACRAWRFAEEDVIGSKLDGAAWARTRWRDPHVVDAAVRLRQGRSAVLDATPVHALLDHVEQALVTAR